ncbi:hypothetical protein PR202_gb00982 [Eleusine coracana subsp. coracana]|uniref:Disease resistance protein At4g27190-like leucine-rich repeats domain-containing protein n=1 Tax=Eleusine coracana subsp. coracana TaxID=191504 RepID=A0AAV5DV32_ELECO|nr:hypothetical protein PR202_gb00982 [Eleusine coracana subsp. coracana]
MMQRRIAEELKLDSNTMALFDMQDKEDDFNGVVPAYRDAIRAVGTVINRTLMESSFIMIFLNGGEEEVVLSRMGVTDFHQSIIIWTFRRRFLTKDMDVIGGSDLRHRGIITSAKTSGETIDKSFTDKTKLQVLDLSGNHQIKSLPTSLSKASSLHMLVLDGCYGLENVVLSNSSLKSFSFDGYGPASNLTLMDEHLEGSHRPKYPSHNVDKKDIKTSFISLKGCTRLENLFLRGLPNLVELNLSGCAIKILDIETMVVHVPRLKRLFLLGCEHLCAIRWRSRAYTHKELVQKQMEHFPLDLELLCIDTRPAARVLGCTRSSVIAQPNKCFKLQVHAITADARLARSLCAPIRHGGIESDDDVYFNIHINSSNDNGEMSKPCDEQHHMDAVATTGVYDDVFIKVGDALTPTMQAFPQPPISKFNHHIEIGEGSQNVESEVEISFTTPSLTHLMCWYVESLHVHDTSTRTATAPADLECLRWCRVERCPNLDLVFPLGSCPSSNLETIWASDLLIARCIWRDGPNQNFGFNSLRHLHLRSCPSLQYALPVWSSSFHSLETLHIIHCGNLRHVFELGKDYDYSVVEFPKLTTIHLHDVPTLQQICKVKMLAPALETVKTRGCWSLRRLPGLSLSKGLRPAPRSQLPTFWWEYERRRPAVEMEKDVWDALEWDGVDAGHHACLYKAPVRKNTKLCMHLSVAVIKS